MANGPTIHASAVLVGAHAILIRGPADSGKSQLALRLIEAAPHGPLLFSRLVADDRVHVAASHGRLIARPAPALAGLLEVRGLGIRRFPYEALAVVSFVVDLGAATAQRLPEGAEAEATVEGIRLPRLAVAPGGDAFPLILAGLTSIPAAVSGSPPA
jgi:serine kinase of HPr protein (carbohydrate metabolism regulator)